MPVEIPERMEMLPIFTFLKKNKEPAHDMTFLKGTVFKDGRLDMCKQVVGPTHIKELCESVRDNEHVKHFLLGNNIALNKGYIEGAEAIAQMIRQKDIETYYLAGNCIDADCMRVLTESLVSNTTCRALWLKRNPIGVEGARYLGDMLNVNHTIEILDLQNCGILDEGIEAFCSAITCQPELFSIRYLYLDANGIGSKGATILCEFFKKYNNFRSIFLGLNPLNTLDELRDGLIANKDLENLAVPSIGLINLDNLKEILIGCPRLKVLNLSVAKGTYDLGAVRNWLDEIDAEPLIDILRECGAQLEFLNMRGFIISDENKERVLNAAPNCVIIIGMNNTQRGNPRLKAFELDNEARKHIREIKHSAMISNIDSIYRT
jgi:Ran GTPase-activating protein (RanGAP) involved in mRNA processing and transport